MRGPQAGAAMAMAPAVALALILGCGGERERTPAAAGAPASPAPAGLASTIAHDPPAAEGAFAPNLAVVSGRLVASWLEPADLDGTSGHRLRVSTLGDPGWSPAATVAEGTDFFANWADFPAVIEAGDGSLLAHWLAKTGEATYAYSIFLARSRDGGASWTPLGPLHDDGTETEHGFVSWISEGDGARAFWLDGREMLSGGAMTLRTAVVGDDIGPAEVLDERVCECCATGAARTASGPLVVYRDRDREEIRDISAVRLGETGWTPPAAVAVDGWKIPGCPVNGPRVAAAGERVAVAWFTAAGAEPRVLAARSDDGGRTFAATRRVDTDAPFGRADVVLGDDGAAWIVWLAKSAERAAVTVRRFSIDGEPGDVLRVAETAGGRVSGFPRLAKIGDRLFVAWVDVGGDAPGRVRIAELATG